MPPAIENDFDNHEWKSEFASHRSGRQSPNIFAKVRRKLLLTPPVRNARSPRLTEEELDALTGDLPYATNYTYAYSKIYDPSLPDHWEVPNLAGGSSSGMLAEQEHWSAASLSRQLLYILRLPIYLVVHVITYILEAFYHIIKISTFSIWDYIMYMIKIVKTRYASYQDNRQRTALIRNRQDSFNTKLAQFIRRFFEFICYVLWSPVRFVQNRKNGVEQYDYISIKDRLENERASRMVTRSQTHRTFGGLSRSPARRVTPAPAADDSKFNSITRITTRVFTNSPVVVKQTTTPVVVTARTVKNRSVTPRVRRTRETITRNAIDTTDAAVDTPLASYGLRSRGASHLNTPEPTFDIGNAAATSTPLFPVTYSLGDYLAEEEQKIADSRSLISTSLSWLAYIIFFPFVAARYVWYTIFDYGKSAYMKWTNYQPHPMEPIYFRDHDDDSALPDDEALLIAKPWYTHVTDFFTAGGSFFSDLVSYIAESHKVVFAMVFGVVQDAANYVCSLFSGLVDQKSSKFNWCNLLGLLLALLLALFLFGFLNSDNTAIRKEALIKENEEAKSTVNGLPAVPIYVRVMNNFKHNTWMVKEYVYDLAFNSNNYVKPILGRTATAPKYAWDLIVSGCGAAGKMFGSIWTVTQKSVGNVWYFFTGGFASANDSLRGFLYGVYNGTSNGVESVAGTTKTFFYDFFSSIYNAFVYVFTSLLNFSTASQNAIIAGLKSVGNGSSNFFYKYIYAPVAGFSNYLTGNWQELLQPLWIALRWIYDMVVFGVSTIFEWACFLVTYPIGLITRGWIKISQYAPEDPVQVLPIPQSITPTPQVERIQEQQPPEILKKKVEVEDEQAELKIIPAPAPEPIPIPTVVPTPAPVVFHSTKIVESIDKEAIINEVTEKLRAELSAQFHQELSAKFEQNYLSIIEKLKVENTHVQYDNHHLEAIIRQLIYEYDTDKTGQVDYALESSGGAVISTRCSETYKSYTRLEKFWDIPIYYHHYSPRVVIQRNSKSLFPGECWCFKEGRGYIAVELSHFIDVSSISYEHIGKEVAPEGNRSSAPKGILVWAYKQIDDLNSRVLIGDYTYDLDGPPLQFFMAKHKPDFPVKFVELEVTSNYGAQFTCLYRLRVHGKMIHV